MATDTLSERGRFKRAQQAADDFYSDLVNGALLASWELRSAADDRDAEMIARRDRFDALPAEVFVDLR